MQFLTPCVCHPLKIAHNKKKSALDSHSLTLTVGKSALFFWFSLQTAPPRANWNRIGGSFVAVLVAVCTRALDSKSEKAFCSSTKLHGGGDHQYKALNSGNFSIILESSFELSVPYSTCVTPFAVAQLIHVPTCSDRL